jgi:hypothetical protein
MGMPPAPWTYALSGPLCSETERAYVFGFGPKIKHKGPTSLVDMNLLEAATQVIAAALSVLHL